MAAPSGISRENRDVASFFCTKHGHALKGKYKRIFSVGTHAITTYNPNTMEVTNQWPYDEFISIVPNMKSASSTEFLINMKKKNGKTDTMKFSSDHRSEILSEALRFNGLFADRHLHENRRYNSAKHHWSDSRIPIILEVNQGSLDQVDPVSRRRICSYDYKEMEGLAIVSDYPGGIAVIHGGFSRLHLFATDNRDELVKAIVENANCYVGIPVKIKKDPITFEQFQRHRLGKYSTDESLTSMAEFSVSKFCPLRHPMEPVKRLLCLTETCLIERDPSSYAVVTCRPLCEVHTLIRYQEDPQRFSVEYVKGFIRTFNSTDRDSLLASLLDGVRASGNSDVHVRSSPTNKGYRQGPMIIPVDEEVETRHVKFLQQLPPGMNFVQAVQRFNSNIPYSGLIHAVTQESFFAENKEKLINGAISALLTNEGDQANIGLHDLEEQFLALRRLVASKAGFNAFTQLPKFREKMGIKVVKALKRNNEGVAHSAIDTLNALIQPMHDNYDLRQEQLNKASILSSKRFLESLLDMFSSHVLRGTGALVISALLDFLTFALCAPYSETTHGEHFDSLLEMVAIHGRAMFKLFQHPSMAIVKGAGLVMKAIIEEGDPEIATKMQGLALAEGALPSHLLTAMFTVSTDSRMLTNRQLSRHLVGLWVTGHPVAMNLLKRILPAGLTAYLHSDGEVPEDADMLHVRDTLAMAQEDDANKNTKTKQQIKELQIQLKIVERQLDQVLSHWRARLGLEQLKLPTNGGGGGVAGLMNSEPEVKPVVLRKRRQRIKSEANWAFFYYQFNCDHAKPNLIWNRKTRDELRESLENEIRAFNADREIAASHVISWNHQEFEVPYLCLLEEIKIGDYFLRLLLEENHGESEELSDIKHSKEFFNDLYHRFLLSSAKASMRCMCLQAMSIVYERCIADIGKFNDIKYIVGMLERTTDRQERDCLLKFINVLLMNRTNVRDLIEANGLRILVDMLTLAHLHMNRAVVPLQTNVIEAGADMKREGEKEWYFGNADKERLGPYSIEEIQAFWNDGTIHAKTRCWAQGLDGWRPMMAIPQLKWTLVASSQANLNETDLSILILNILIRLCTYFPSRDEDGAIVRPLPKVKRLLSDATCFPHIVQLLLTFDPLLVEKTATLLNLVVADNPISSRLYQTGVFYFILMYTGSNVIPIAKFLKYTHMRQAFRSEDDSMSDIMQRSILGHILPEAMVCYLENYSEEKFAKIFLGEYDTPEAIWNSEMRRRMIEKIAAHLADFSPRLQSNTRAFFQYSPIPYINYPQLDEELFCNIYYLRHFCDTLRFPNWEVKDPIKLLKDALAAWQKEVEKKPPSMSINEALETLGLQPDVQHDESKVKKAYFRLAQKYHPDKNPDGREMFEAVNKAYEFICSRSAKKADGPDPHNIVLILRTQSILFKGHREVLQPFKYAGYPMLIKTIKLETCDDQLFSKDAPLLAAATELCYHTINCSALNAEELRREDGIKILHDAFTRCVAVINKSSKETDVAVQVCLHVCRCYAAASQFESCREKIIENPAIIKDICRCMYFRQLPQLCGVAAECASAFARDFWLQTNLFRAGVLWHLIPRLFNYDFTLEESGVEKAGEGESNAQEVANGLARRSLYAIARLGGYVKMPTSQPRTVSQNGTPSETPLHGSAGESGSLDKLSQSGDAGQMTQSRTSSNGSKTPSEAGTPSQLGADQNDDAGSHGSHASQDAPAPENPEVQKSISALLTPYLATKLNRGEDSHQINWILKILNSNSETPYLIWDNMTREELKAYVGEQQRTIIGTGECDPTYGSEFVYSTHSKELIVGDVFVRVYNEQPSYPLENPKGFTIDLLEFLGSQAQYLHSLMSLTESNNLDTSKSSDRLGAVEQALEALRNVIKSNPGNVSDCDHLIERGGVEIQCIGHFKLLFSLLSLNGCPKLQMLAVEAISLMTSNQECVNDIAASDVLVYLLLALHTLPAGLALTLDTLSALMTSTSIVKEAHNRGALVYLLDIFANAQDQTLRECSAALLGKMMRDRLVGREFEIATAKFLPPKFQIDMKESPAAAVAEFEGIFENPELIWDVESREKVCGTLAKMRENQYKNQCNNPSAVWRLPKDFAPLYSNAEMSVDGVYLRIFNNNPGWTLKRPKEFTIALLETWAGLASQTAPPTDDLQMVTEAAKKLFVHKPEMMDNLPSTGIVTRVFQIMCKGNQATCSSALDLGHLLASSPTCVNAMTSFNAIASIKAALLARPDAAFHAIDTLYRLFKGPTLHGELVAQMLQTEMITLLLGILDGGRISVDGMSLDTPLDGSVRGIIAETLKELAKPTCPYGPQIETMLDKAPVWKQYKYQDHRFFIPDSTNKLAIAGPVGAPLQITGATTPSSSRLPPAAPTSPPEL